MLSHSRDSVQLVSAVRDDKHVNVVGGISMKVQADLFEQSVQLRRGESLTD